MSVDDLWFLVLDTSWINTRYVGISFLGVEGFEVVPKGGLVFPEDLHRVFLTPSPLLTIPCRVFDE